MERLRIRMANRVRRLQRRQCQLVDEYGYVPTGRRYEYQSLMQEINMCHDGLQWLHTVIEEEEPCLEQ